MNLIKAHRSFTSRGLELLDTRRLLSGATEFGAPIGDEFLVNTYTDSFQYKPAVASDADGDFVVIWESVYQDPDPQGAEGVYGQRFNAAGEPQGGEFVVPTQTGLSQTDPAVSMDAAGNFIVVWRTPTLYDNIPSGSIRARLFNADGTPRGDEFAIETAVAGARVDPDVLMAANGSFVVTWYGGEEPDPYTTGIWVRRFSSDGTPVAREARVDRELFPNTPMEPAVAMNDAGDFAVTWRAVKAGGNSWDVYAQRFNAAGVTVGDEIRVNTDIAGFQTNPDIDMDAVGNFTIVWQSPDIQGVDGIWARRFDASGNALGDQYLVNTFLAGPQQAPFISIGAAGDLVVAWSSPFQDPDSSSGVYAQRFDEAGNKLGDEFRFSATGLGPQVHPAIAIDDQGNVITAWAHGREDGPLYNYDVLARRFNVTDIEATNVVGDFAAGQSAHAVQLQFDDDVVTTLSIADLTVIGIAGTPTPAAGSMQLSYDADLRLGAIRYNGGQPLPEGRYRATVAAAGVADVIGNHLAADYVFDFAFYRGDATGDGQVDLSDFSILAANFNRAGTFDEGDFDYSGQVDIGDFSILASRFNAGLPQPRSLQGVGGWSARSETFSSERVISLLDEGTAAG